MADLILREPIELTDEELDAVTGGLLNVFNNSTTAGIGVGAVQSTGNNSTNLLSNIAVLNIGVGIGSI